MSRFYKGSFETTLYYEKDDQEVEVKVTYCGYPGSPGKTSGEPETCYPPEPSEMDIEVTRVDNGKPVELPEDQLENLKEKAWEDVEGRLDDAEERRAEEIQERRADRRQSDAAE